MTPHMLARDLGDPMTSPLTPPLGRIFNPERYLKNYFSITMTFGYSIHVEWMMTFIIFGDSMAFPLDTPAGPAGHQH